MTEFIDAYMPEEIPGYPCVSAPRFKTSIRVNASGKENANQEWEHPLRKFILPDGIRDWDAVLGLNKMWYITAGPFKHFPWRDPLDCASIDLAVPNEVEADLIARLSMTDQTLGTGDGFTTSFQIFKTYTYGGETYDRSIHLPVTSTLLVSVNGVLKTQGADYTATRPGGAITFAVPPPNGHLVKAGFLFDNEVRFESDDSLETAVRTWQAAGFADITLLEVPPC